MDKVLFLSGSQEDILACRDGLEGLHQFETVFAGDNSGGIKLLATSSISVLVMDIHSPGIDGLELLAHMTRHHPRTPCIVISAAGKPWFKNRTGQQELLYHLEKPFNMNMLASAVLVALNLRDEGIVRNGISMTSFLPLIELEKKTCRLDVSAPGMGKGYLYFDMGVLFDAHFKDLRGEIAAREIASWHNVDLKISDLPPRRTSRRVTVGIMDLSGASWSREAAVGDGSDPEEPPPVLFEIPPEETPPVSRADPLSRLFQVYRSQLRSIVGYKAVAILDTDDRILESDADGAAGWENKFASLSRVFALFDQALAEEDWKSCQGATVHLAGDVVLIAGPGIGSRAKVKVIGILAAGGNWYFMKLCLERMVSQLQQEVPALRAE